MKQITTLILLTLIVSTALAQEAKNDSVEFKIIKTLKTALPQTFVNGGTIKNGELTWNTVEVRPNQCTQQGVIFGIIYYKIKNNTSSDLKLISDSLCLKVNDIKRITTGEFYIDKNTSVFGGKSMEYTLKAGQEKTTKMLFTSMTKILKNVTIEYENLIPYTRITFE